MPRKLILTVVACVLALLPAKAIASERRSPVVRAVEKSRNAVVNVFTETAVETPFRGRSPFAGDPFFEDFFSDFFRGPRSAPRSTERRSLGSGVIIDKDGTIVTNEHVIVHASKIRVLLDDNREYDAELIGADSDFDLAILKVDTTDPLPFVELSDDDDIMIGETVVAIGNPYGLSHTVTVGVVSAVGRTIQAGDVVYHDFIQTDASINPGNSGGPLIDVDGRLIGINTAIHRAGEGIGFAIPAYRARSIVEQIMHYGGVLAPWTGLRVQDLTAELAFHFGGRPGVGVLVADVEETSPAAKADIRQGDIITHVDEERVTSVGRYARATASLTAGDKLELSITRKSEAIKRSITIATYPVDRLDSFAWNRIGVRVGNAEKYQGVAVEQVRRGSNADAIGLEKNDVIVAIGGREIADLDAFRRRLAAYRNSNAVLLSVLRGRRLYRVTVPIK